MTGMSQIYLMAKTRECKRDWPTCVPLHNHTYRSTESLHDGKPKRKSRQQVRQCVASRAQSDSFLSAQLSVLLPSVEVSGSVICREKTRGGCRSVTENNMATFSVFTKKNDPFNFSFFYLLSCIYTQLIGNQKHFCRSLIEI